jgi:DNA segregation ATPase FtsK/SpoIIIE-like protein
MENGKDYNIDLSVVSNILVGGSKGRGKSNLLKNIINDLVEGYTPEIVKFVLVNLKKQRFRTYKKSPHLYCPIINTVEQYYMTINKAIKEIDTRLKLFKEYDCYNIKDYNSKTKAQRISYTVIIIDEFKDLILADKYKFENTLSKLALKGRAAGIIIICSTQAINLISGAVKASLLNRICFKVKSAEKSKRVMDVSGAENIKNRGAMILQYMVS